MEVIVRKDVPSFTRKLKSVKIRVFLRWPEFKVAIKIFRSDR